MKNDRIVLRPGKEKALRHRHPWVFSGAIATGGKNRSGDLLPVYSAQGDFLGTGYFNTKSSIIGRMICFDERPPLEAIGQNIQRAIALRQQLFVDQKTTGYRLINGEGDDLPGLIVDNYAGVLVLQIGTLGMERLRDTIVKQLVEQMSPKAVYEKSALPSRAEEGLKDVTGWLYGKPVALVEMEENGLRYQVSPEQGQKTGFFLDQREMRSLVRRFAAGRNVLNCFSYTGAFSVAALAGGAASVISVDTSRSALNMAMANTQLNGFAADVHELCEADVFRYLRDEPIDSNLIILDPPAFAKRRSDVVQGCRGYKDINRLAISKAPSGSWLVTCSCSHFVDDTLFQQVVFQAASEAKRSVRILARHHAALDHPVSVYHPEAHYLKSLVLYID